VKKTDSAQGRGDTENGKCLSLAKAQRRKEIKKHFIYFSLRASAFFHVFAVKGCFPAARFFPPSGCPDRVGQTAWPPAILGRLPKGRFGGSLLRYTVI